MERIAYKEKIGYGFGDMASSMFWKIFGMYLLFFYTEVYGLSPAIVGTMFLVTRIWDSINDPIMGLIADRTKSKHGRYRPYILYGAVPFALVGVLTFIVPDLGQTWKIIYAYVTYTFMMMIYTAVNVPYASLLGVMTSSSRERTSLSSYRMFFAYIGSLLTFFIFQPMVDWFSKITGGQTSQVTGMSTDPTAWILSVSIIGLMSAVLFFLCFRWTKERIQISDEKKIPVRQDLKHLLICRPWWTLVIAGILILVFNSIRDGVAIFYFSNYAPEIPDFYKWSSVTLFLMLGQLANMLGVLSAVPMAKIFGKKRAFTYSTLAAALFSIIFYWAQPQNYLLIFALQSIISFFAGSVFPIMWSMYADIVDSYEKEYGNRPSGLIFSSSSMSQKFGWAFGSALSGWLLAFFGYESQSVLQQQETIEGIRMLMSFIPALACILSAIVISTYTERKSS